MSIIFFRYRFSFSHWPISLILFVRLFSFLLESCNCCSLFLISSFNLLISVAIIAVLPLDSVSRFSYLLISCELLSSWLHRFAQSSIYWSLLPMISLHFLISFSRADLSFWNRVVISLISLSRVDLLWFSIMFLSSSISLILLFSAVCERAFHR